MARMRTLKPEAFTSETLAALPVHARWTFAGLWCYTDDEGRGRANAGLVKAAIWPLDEDVSVKHVEHLLDELEAAGLICRYEVDGKAYLHVVNFGEHQHPNRPVESKLPACTRRTHGGLSAGSLSPQSGGPGGGSSAAKGAPEVKGAAKTAQTGRSTGKRAGQGTLTEDAVRTHGGVPQNSSGIPPTPRYVDTGDGVGGVDVGGVQQASPAAANGSRPPDEPLSVTQRSKRITDAYAKAERMCNWSGINTIVIKAIQAEKFTDDEICDALLRMAADKLTVTVDSLRVELQGFGSRRDRPNRMATTDRRMADAQALKAQLAVQPLGEITP